MKTATKEKDPKPKKATDAERVAASALQREYIRRLREVHGDLKGKVKHAKSCLEAAIADLERMADAGAPGEVFPGVLVIDTKTGEIKNYKSLDEIAAEEERDRQEKDKSKSEALDTTSKLPGKTPPKGVPEVERAFDALKESGGKVLDGPGRKKKRRATGKDAAAGEGLDRDDDEDLE